MYPVLLLFNLLLAPPYFDSSSTVVLGVKDGFAFITNDSIFYTADGNDFTSRKHYFGIDLYRMDPVPKVNLSSDTFFVSDGGGVVYRYNELLDTLVRWDNSYRFLSRFGEAKVSYQDTIYSFGGYGEFSYDNKLLTFKSNFREWSVVPLEGPILNPVARSFIQYDSVANDIIIGGGVSTYFKDGAEILSKHDEIIRFTRDFKSYQSGSLKSVYSKLNEDPNSLESFKSFPFYRLPMVYSKYDLWTFDLVNLKAFHHFNSNKELLQQYTVMLAYNRQSNKFLMSSNYSTKDPRYHVVNELDLLGLEYEEYSLAEAQLPKWAYPLFGLALLLLIPVFRTKSFVVLNEAIQSHERRIQQRLSSEDFHILQLISQAYPEYVEYPELQNSYEKDLSYESRIKKLRASIKEIDEVVQDVIGRKRSSIFEIEKGREDKRVKVIRIKNDQLKQIDFFGKLKRTAK